MNSKSLLLVGITFLGLSPALAPSVLGQNVVFVKDASFEGITSFTTTTAAGGLVNGSIGAWTTAANTGVLPVTGATGSAAVTSGATSASSGTFATTFSFTGLTTAASITQQLTTAGGAAINFVPNSIYSLSIDINPSTFALSLANTNIALLNNGVVFATLSGANILTQLLAGTATYQTVTLNAFSGLATGQVGIQVSTVNGASVTAGSFLVDNVRLTQTPIPEPSTIAASLAGAGLLGLVMRRRRALA